MQRLLAILFVLSLCLPAKADDWPRWFGPNNDDSWTEDGLVEKFPEGGPKIVWRQPVQPGYAGPSVVGDRIYLMDFERRQRREGENKSKVFGTERVLCLDATTGAIVWQHSYATGYKVSYPEGPRTTPTVDGDRVYALGTMGHLMCLNAATGNVIWSKNLPLIYECTTPIWGYAIHPIVDGDKLICAVGGRDSALVALDKHDGSEIWSSLTVKEIGYAPPVFVHEGKNRQLVFWHDLAIVGVNPETGSKLWRVEFPIGKEPNPSQPATPIATPLVIDGRKVLVSSFFDGSILLDVAAEPPAAKTVWVSDADDKKHEDDLNALMTTPVAQGDHFYGVAGETGELRCLSLDDYKLAWRSQGLVSKKKALFGTAFLVRNKDRYFIWTDQGELVLAKLSPKEYTEIDRAKILDPTFGARGRKVTWSHPAFSNGRMYVRNFKELVCVDLRADQ